MNHQCERIGQENVPFVPWEISAHLAFLGVIYKDKKKKSFLLLLQL